MATRRGLALPRTGPQVHLLEAGPEEPDEAALRVTARQLSAGLDARHVSRSYRYPYALVAGYAHPLGVDLERIEPLDRRFLESILTPAERDRVGLCQEPGAVTSLWCSKEALAKALGDALRYDPRRLDSPVGWPSGQSGPWRAAALDAPAGHVAWLCWRSG